MHLLAGKWPPSVRDRTVRTAVSGFELRFLYLLMKVYNLLCIVLGPASTSTSLTLDVCLTTKILFKGIFTAKSFWTLDNKKHVIQSSNLAKTLPVHVFGQAAAVKL